MKVLRPVIAGCVECVLHALPGDALGGREEDAGVAALVRLHHPPERLAERGKELVRPPSRPSDVHDDGRQWHSNDRSGGGDACGALE